MGSARSRFSVPERVGGSLLQGGRSLAGLGSGVPWCAAAGTSIALTNGGLGASPHIFGGCIGPREPLTQACGVPPRALVGGGYRCHSWANVITYSSITMCVKMVQHSPPKTLSSRKVLHRFARTTAGSTGSLIRTQRTLLCLSYTFRHL